MRAASASVACALSLVARVALPAPPAALQPSSPPLLDTPRPGGQDDKSAHLSSFVMGFAASVLSDVDPKDAKAATKVWADMIMRRKNQKVESQAVVYDGLASMEAALRASLVDFVWLPPKVFLEARDHLPIVPIVISTPLRGLFNEFVLVVRRDARVTTVRELKNKRLTMETEHDGSIPMIWLETLLMKEAQPERPEQFFASVKGARKPSHTILPVFFGQADACIASRSAFETVVELNPQVGKELETIASSAPFVSAIGSLRKDFFAKYEPLVTANLELLHDDPQGRQILTLFKQGRLLRFKESYLATVEQLLKEHEALRLKSIRRP